MSTLYDQFVARAGEIADISHASAVLSWDQEVNAPAKSAPGRSRQLSTLSGMAHDLFVRDDLGEWLEALRKENGLNAVQQHNVAKAWKDYTKARKLDRAFVESLSQARSRCFQDWQKAREANDFGVYSSALETMFALKREEAERLGYEEHPYDALMDAYEPDARTKQIQAVFRTAREQLVQLIQAIAAAAPVPDDFLTGAFPHDKQWAFGLDVLKAMGYDFEAGRQDVSTHPFTISFGPGDIRITTRVDESNFREMLWSCIHEGGHALYEQGLPADQYGLPAGEAASLGIHESQSRLWENNVGRAMPFWKHWYPRLQKEFPTAFGNVALRDFYRAINKVAPSLIRTEADELTYHAHIMVRFEIEVGLIDGSMAIKDLRDIWNEKYKTYLGVEVPDDRRGVLQDIHWSHGSIGYFATYSLGSFYAVQFMDKAKEELPGLEDDIARGDNQRLLTWLRKHIHAAGRQFTSEEICQQATGAPLDVNRFMAYAKTKYGEIYNL